MSVLCFFVCDECFPYAMNAVRAYRVERAWESTLDTTIHRIVFFCVIHRMTFWFSFWLFTQKSYAIINAHAVERFRRAHVRACVSRVTTLRVNLMLMLTFTSHRRDETLYWRALMPLDEIQIGKRRIPFARANSSCDMIYDRTYPTQWKYLSA